jgi:two-component system sensor histidine kinase CiaH
MNDHKYKITRLKLTALYFLIIIFLLAAFSIIIIADRDRQFYRFDKIQDKAPMGINMPPPKIPEEKLKEIESTINEIKFNTTINILLIDIFCALLAALLSYYLSGQTLKPILETVEKQKHFIADASHELKTPLTVLKTEAEVMARSKNATQEEYKDFANSVVYEVDRLTNLTNNLLTIAKSDGNAQALKSENLNLVETSREVMESMKNIAKEKKINLEFKSPIEKLEVFINKSRLEELVSIFIDNAIKYNKENGSIIVEIENQEKPALKIKDTGIGIAKENQEKIFDRFTRVSEDRNQKGFGLGLSIAKQICEENGIEIKVESEIEKGTTVNLIFPISPFLH